MKHILTFITTVACIFVLSINAHAQNYELKGVVKDQLGPVAGVAVIEKGTNTGAITDLDGVFSLKVSSSEAVIEISCMGYITQTYKASELPSTIQIVEDNELLDDVVVIGYGSQKKKEVTSSVASVKSEDFNAGVKSSPIGLLQGKVAGLNISRTTADPTSTGFNVQIRGFSTLDKGAGTSPLYIVDGVPVSSIDNISPDEIASMDVLKDGSAAAIYGTRGTNGVIIITTKRGENFSEVASTHVEYAGYASVSVRNSDLGMATADEYIKLSELSAGKVTPQIYDENTKTDWMKEMTRPAAFTHNHNVAIVGSSNKFNYRASFNYKNAEGIARNNNRNELISKIAASQKALDGWLEMNYDMSYMRYRNDYFTGDFKQAATLNPTYPILDPTTESGYYAPQGTGETNPVEALNNKESYQEGNYFRGSIKATLNIKPIKGLKLNAFGAIEEGDNYDFWNNGTLNKDKEGSGRAGRKTNFSRSKLFEATADYANTFGEHHIAAIAGFSYQNFLYDGSEMENKGFPTAASKYFQMGNGDPEKTFMKMSSYRNSNTLAAFFARTNYNYQDKYLLSASIRREGSSRFGINNKWGWFPAVSLGWRVTGEDFMQGVTWVNDLKVRAGFGVTGNNLASDLKSVAMLSNSGTFWYNGKYVNTYGVSQNVNPDLKWEKKFEYNLGADFSLLDNRLYGSLDVYYRQTRDLLWDYEVPTPPYQYPTLLANAGQMDSYGAELAISYVPIKTKDLTWVTTPTLSFNHNVITKLSDPSKGFNYNEITSGTVSETGMMNTETQIIREKQSVGAFYGYELAGIQDGVWYFNTPNGGIVDTDMATENHKKILGSAQPWFTFGWNNTVRYKEFDFSLFFRGVVGNKILNLTRWAFGPMPSVSSNIFMKDIKGSDTVIANKSVFSDYYLESGSFVKLDNITIGYTFNFKDKLVDNLRVYLTGQNLATITKYSGQDPEVNTTSVWDSGIDYCSFYPTVATILLGVNVSFK